MKIFTIAILLMLVTGCGVTYQTAELKEIITPAHTQVSHLQKEGFCVVTRELTARESESYLGLNLKNYRYTPILMSMENTAQKAFKIKTTNIQIVNDKGDKVKPAAVEEVLTQTNYSHWRVLPCWIILVPGIFFAIPSHNSISRANQNMEKDYTAKSFRRDGYILNAKDEAHALIFFKNAAQGTKYDYVTMELEQLGETEAEPIKTLTITIPIS